jgi:hypothetical protein
MAAKIGRCHSGANCERVTPRRQRGFLEIAELRRIHCGSAAIMEYIESIDMEYMESMDMEYMKSIDS